MNAFKASQTTYAVSVKKAAGFSQHDVARLHVSVGGPNHEGEKLVALVEWLMTRFKHVVVCVNDTLQRHNLKFEKGLPDAMAVQITHGYGDHWVARNRHALDLLPSRTILRWDETRANPAYAGLLADITGLYESVPAMKEAIDSVVTEFWDRRCKRVGVTEDFRLPLFQQHSRAYLLEEMAVFILMFGQSAADVYPGSIRLPFRLTEDLLPQAGPVGYGDKVFTHLSLVRKSADMQTA